MFWCETQKDPHVLSLFAVAEAMGLVDVGGCLQQSRLRHVMSH